MPAKVVIILLLKKKYNKYIYIYKHYISAFAARELLAFALLPWSHLGFGDSGLRNTALGSQLCQQQGVTLIKSLGTLGWVQGDPAQQLLGVGSPSSSQNSTCLSFPNHHSQFCAISVALPCQNLIETGF